MILLQIKKKSVYLNHSFCKINRSWHWSRT